MKLLSMGGSNRFAWLRRIARIGPVSIFWLLVMSSGTRAQTRELASPAAENVVAESTMDIRADSQDKQKETYHLRGHVAVTYQAMRMTADEATFNEASQEVTAKGHVTFTDPALHVEAEEGNYNFRSSRGEFLNALGSLRTVPHAAPRLMSTEPTTCIKL